MIKSSKMIIILLIVGIIFLISTIIFLVFKPLEKVVNIKTFNEYEKVVYGLFEIPQGTNAKLLSVTLENDDYEGDMSLAAKFIIPSDEKDVIFAKYNHLKKYESTENADATFNVKDYIPVGCELDYYCYRYNSVRKPYGIFGEVETQQTQGFIFMKEKDGMQIVILFCNNANWDKYKG